MNVLFLVKNIRKGDRMGDMLVWMDKKVEDIVEQYLENKERINECLDDARKLAKKIKEFKDTNFRGSLLITVINELIRNSEIPRGMVVAILEEMKLRILLEGIQLSETLRQLVTRALIEREKQR